MLENMPIIPSRFETLVSQLGLTDRPEDWEASNELRQWAKANRHSYFVPERLLAEWRLTVTEER
jgi:hypothetical protein